MAGPASLPSKVNDVVFERRRALAIDEDALSPDHPDTCALVSKLA